MAFAVSSIKTVVVIAILASLAVTMMVQVQESADVNATENPEAAAAQTSINTNTWNSLKMVGIVMLVIIIAVVMKYLNFI
jgi:predicted transcriptional regulator